MSKHNFGQTLKLQNVVVGQGYQNIINFFSVSKQCISVSLVEINLLVQKTQLRKRLILQYLKDSDLDN